MMTLEEAIHSVSLKHHTESELKTLYAKLEPTTREVFESIVVTDFIRNMCRGYSLILLVEPESAMTSAFCAGILFGMMMERQDTFAQGS